MGVRCFEVHPHFSPPSQPSPSKSLQEGEGENRWLKANVAGGSEQCRQRVAFRRTQLEVEDLQVALTIVFAQGIGAPRRRAQRLPTAVGGDLDRTGRGHDVALEEKAASAENVLFGPDAGRVDHRRDHVLAGTKKGTQVVGIL